VDLTNGGERACRATLVDHRRAAGMSPIVRGPVLALGKRRGTLIASSPAALYLPTVNFDISPEVRLQLSQNVAIGMALLVECSPRKRGALFPISLAMDRYADAGISSYSHSSGCSQGNGLSGGTFADIALAARVRVPRPLRRAGAGPGGGGLTPKACGGSGSRSWSRPWPMYRSVAFEMVMGPRWYLAGLVYGIKYREAMVERLGGWRPEGFFMEGISLSLWMASAAVVAFWLGYGRLWKPRYGPAWVALGGAHRHLRSPVEGSTAISYWPLGWWRPCSPSMFRTRWVPCVTRRARSDLHDAPNLRGMGRPDSGTGREPVGTLRDRRVPPSRRAGRGGERVEGTPCPGIRQLHQVQG